MLSCRVRQVFYIKLGGCLLAAPDARPAMSARSAHGPHATLFLLVVGLAHDWLVRRPRRGARQALANRRGRVQRLVAGCHCSRERRSRSVECRHSARQFEVSTNLAGGEHMRKACENLVFQGFFGRSCDFAIGSASGRRRSIRNCDNRRIEPIQI